MWFISDTDVCEARGRRGPAKPASQTEAPCVPSSSSLSQIWVARWCTAAPGKVLLRDLPPGLFGDGGNGCLCSRVHSLHGQAV